MLGLTAMVAAACLGATLAPATAQAAPATPRLGLEIGSLAFSVQELGVASPAQDVLLHNLGDATLHVATVHATGRYTAADDCRADPGDAVTLDPGESCAVHVTFTPLATGKALGALLIASDGGTRSLPLEGGASRRAPAVSFDEGGIEFSPQKVGTRSEPQLLTVRNAGNAVLHADRLAARGPFQADSSSCPAAPGDKLTLTPGGSCVVKVTFTAPPSAGRQDGQLEIVSDDPSATRALPIGGLGIARLPALSFDQASLAFAQQRVGSASVPQIVSLRNSGRATLHVTAIDAIGPFNVSAGAGCPVGPGDVVTLDPGDRCPLFVTFSPSLPAGLRTGSLRLESDAPGSVFTLALEGLGTGGAIQVGAGAAGGGYVLLPGAPSNTEAWRERFEFAFRVNGDGTVRGKQLTSRFAEGGVSYVLRSTAIDRGSLIVSGSSAVFSGQGVVTRVGAGGAKTALPGVYSFAVALTDIADPGVGLDTISILVDDPAGNRFHALARPRAQARLASGNLGVRLH